ncbi:MAG: DUF695 domain-containing protein [Gammaproteobacteria bacterium]|nr:DUF695 domain-containing protein [Gammaproteobacteria bacterium]
MKKDYDWSVYFRDYQGHPLSLRLNKNVEAYICHAKYIYQLTITVPLSTMDIDGYPYAEENRLLMELEALLQDRLETSSVSVFVAVVTTDGVRMFILYTFLPEYCEKMVKEINRDWVYHNLAAEIQQDEHWELLESLVNS